MLVLALDTTTRQGSMALARDGRLLEAFSGDASVTHGERLPNDLLRLLDAHRVRLADVDLYAVAAGPGSFTGLRIGIASMQGLAMANGRPLAGVSALDALNDAAANAVDPTLPPASTVAAWMDAQRGQVFSAVYRGSGLVDPPVVDAPAGVLDRWRSRGVDPDVFVGDGALAFEALIRAHASRCLIVEPVPLLAPSISRLAEGHFRAHGPLPPEAIRPIYIRRPDAEIARDRREAASGARAPRA